MKTNSTNFVNFFFGMHQNPSPSFEFILKLHVCLQKLPLSSRYKRFCDILKMKIEILNEHFFRIFKRSLKTLIFYNRVSHFFWQRSKNCEFNSISLKFLKSCYPPVWHFTKNWILSPWIPIIMQNQIENHNQ